MLVLVFYLGETMYVAKYTKVQEVVPMVLLKKAPHTPSYFSGYFNYRGVLTPVFDLRRILQNEACQIRLSTRIILVDHPVNENLSQGFGLIAERVTETIHKPEKSFIAPPLELENISYLKEVMMEGDEMIQCIDLKAIIEKFRHLPLTEDSYLDEPWDDVDNSASST